MTKNLLSISLISAGLILGAIGVLAQETTSAQPATSATPVPILSPVSVGSSDVPEIDLRPGIRHPQVKKVQELLKSLGYLPASLKTTENLGPLTRDALKKFQQDNGLPASGFFGPATRTALKNKLKERVGEAVIDRNVDLACMKTAVGKRETALLSAWDTYAGKIKTARETRKTDLLAAWSIQDPSQRHQAIKSAWEKYRQSLKTARTEWNQSRRTIWIQFVQESKNCRASAVETQDLESVDVVEE